MLAVTALLPLLAVVSAGPVSKRYTGVNIVSGRDGLCISPNVATAADLTDGTPVVSMPCSDVVLTWDIDRGSGSVIVYGTNFALDAGTNPSNNGLLKVWQSYPTLTQQTWYYTGDNRIAITGGTQCLDEGPDGIQIYQCTTGDTNQIFYVNSGSPTPSSTSASPSSTSSAAPTPTAKRIHPNGNTALCVSVIGGQAAEASPVQIADCLPGSSPYYPLQLWDLPTGQGVLQLSGTSYCLDAGSDPANGGIVHLWDCNDTYQQQLWTYTQNNLQLASNSQCLDVEECSEPGTQTPFPSIENLQTWECSSNNDPQQIFTVS